MKSNKNYKVDHTHYTLNVDDLPYVIEADDMKLCQMF